jgi:hypothetical protein
MMQSRGNGIGTIGTMSVLVALGFGGAPGAARAADPLDGLEVSAKRIGWDGVELGMSFVQAERRFGTTLPLSENPKARCGRFVSGSERGGLSMQVGFPSSKPGAKIETIFVRFEGQQVTADAAALVAALRARLPDARYVPDADMPDTTEAEHPAPTFEVVLGEETYAIQLRPRDGLFMARRDCLP